MNKRCYLTYIKDNKILLVREVNEDSYKLPGGRLEEGETIKDTLIREIKEEINSVVDPNSLKLIANYVYQTKDTSNVWDTYLFTAEIEGTIKPDGKEIEEVIWYSADSDLELKSHMRSHVLPILVNGGYLNASK